LIAGQVLLHGIASVDIYIGDYALAMGRLEEALRLLHDSPTRPPWPRSITPVAGLRPPWRSRASARVLKPRSPARWAIARRSPPVSTSRCAVPSPRAAASRRGDFYRARRSEEAVAIAEEAGDPHLKALATGNVGNAM
jgi:hypothetical protein